MQITSCITIDYPTLYLICISIPIAKYRVISLHIRETKYFHFQLIWTVDRLLLLLLKQKKILRMKIGAWVIQSYYSTEWNDRIFQLFLFNRKIADIFKMAKMMVCYCNRIMMATFLRFNGKLIGIFRFTQLICAK